eukprot:g1800.t1
MMKLKLIFLFLFHLITNTSCKSTLLVVIGEVTSNSARLLVDCGVNIDIFAYISSKGENIEKQLVQIGSEGPTVVRFQNLNPGQHYAVIFSDKEDGGFENVSVANQKDIDFGPSATFTTPKDGGSNLKLLIASCNRVNEDNDTRVLDRMHSENAFATLWIGDQIYADFIAKDAVRDCRNGKYQTAQSIFETSLQKYYELYRKVWLNPAVSAILRTNANYMIPDDHDILNDVDTAFLWDKNELVKGHLNIPTGKIDKPRDAKRIAILAGLVSVVQYQLGLRVDVPQIALILEAFGVHKNDLPLLLKKTETISSENLQKVALVRETVTESIFITFGKTAIALLETRLWRFIAPAVLKDQFDARTNLLMNPISLQHLKAQLEKWRENPQITNVIAISSAPLLFHNHALAQVAWVAEQGRSPTHPDMYNSTEQLLHLLFQSKLKLLVGGDYHQYSEQTICQLPHYEKEKCVKQIVTSGITRKNSIASSRKLTLFFSFVFHLSAETFSPSSLLLHFENFYIEMCIETIRFFLDLKSTKFSKLLGSLGKTTNVKGHAFYVEHNLENLYTGTNYLVIYETKGSLNHIVRRVATINDSDYNQISSSQKFLQSAFMFHMVFTLLCILTSPISWCFLLLYFTRKCYCWRRRKREKNE